MSASECLSDRRRQPPPGQARPTTPRGLGLCRRRAAALVQTRQVPTRRHSGAGAAIAKAACPWVPAAANHRDASATAMTQVVAAMAQIEPRNHLEDPGRRNAFDRQAHSTQPCWSLHVQSDSSQWLPRREDYTDLEHFPAWCFHDSRQDAVGESDAACMAPGQPRCADRANVTGMVLICLKSRSAMVATAVRPEQDAPPTRRLSECKGLDAAADRHAATTQWRSNLR